MYTTPDHENTGVGPDLSTEQVATSDVCRVPSSESAGEIPAPPPPKLGTRVGLTLVGLLVLVAAFCAGILFDVSTHTASVNHSAAPQNPERREFMFQVNELKTANQGGQVINLYFHYRYNSGIAERDIPNYLSLRKVALDYLTTIDASKNPYWETLNKHICSELKSSFPIEAISCELQTVGNEALGAYEPGYHASIETIGDIDPLSVLGPPANPAVAVGR